MSCIDVGVGRYLWKIMWNKRCNVSKRQNKGEPRRKNPCLLGNSHILPEGWVMEFKARGTRPQNADCHDTAFVEGRTA